MTIDFDRLLKLRLRSEQIVTPRDVMLYALSLGFGADPLDESQLRFVYEDELLAVPSMAMVIAYCDLAPPLAELGIDTTRMLHGEQQFELIRPLPVAAHFEAETVVTKVIDKGPGRGLLICERTELRDKVSGEQLAILNSSHFCRSDGGCAEGVDTNGANSLPRHTVPSSLPDFFYDIQTLPQTPLLYRLSGDYHPLHASPSFARSAGFERPILHGRCTFGIAGHALLRRCGYEVDRLKAMTARFTEPAFPGDTLRTEIWDASGSMLFRVRALERDVIVLDGGLAGPGDSNRTAVRSAR